MCSYWRPCAPIGDHVFLLETICAPIGDHVFLLETMCSYWRPCAPIGDHVFLLETMCSNWRPCAPIGDHVFLLAHTNCFLESNKRSSVDSVISYISKADNSKMINSKIISNFDKYNLLYMSRHIQFVTCGQMPS